MATWLYQINPKLWPPDRYRIEIWEAEKWRWPVGRKVSGGAEPRPGDIVTFYYAQTGGVESGFYGWAIVLEWYEDELYFRPTTPSDHLKMDPWGEPEARTLADAIRGKVKQGTLWLVKRDLESRLRKGIRGWLTSGSGS